MPQAETFWIELLFFIQQHSQFCLLLSLALIIAASLWRWRSQERKPVATALLLVILVLCGYAFSGVFSALNFTSLASVLQEISFFAGGMVIIRLLGLFLFRLILPLCRISLLRILEDLAELAGYGAWFMMYLHGAGFNLSGIITTSAVMTAVLAFSMQDTLGMMRFSKYLFWRDSNVPPFQSR